MKVLLLFEFIPFLIVENEHYFIQYVWRKGKDNSKTINSILWKFIYGIACICNNDAQLANVFNFYCTWRNNDRLIQWFILERSKSGVERIKSASSQVVALDTIWKNIDSRSATRNSWWWCSLLFTWNDIQRISLGKNGRVC